jgi:Spy/CpxP family protein refolding chaperone
MKKMLSSIITAVVVLGGASVYAGPACCAATAKAKAEAEAKADKFGCGDILAKLNLTDEQKTKLAALQTECDKASCTVSSRDKYISGLRQILTAEQLEQCKTECEKAGAKNCPLAAAAKKDGSQS